MKFARGWLIALCTEQPIRKVYCAGGREERVGRGSVCYCTGGLTSNASGDLLSLLAAFDFPYVFVARLNAKRSSSLFLSVCVGFHNYYREKERERERVEYLH